VTITVSNNVIIGTNNPAYGSDYGFYAFGPISTQPSVATLVFQHNEIRETGSNPILIERFTGPTDVSYNTFARGMFSGAVSAYVNMSHTNTPITTLQRVRNNTINMAPDPGPYTSSNGGSAIGFIGALTGTTIGTFSNVEISGNTITNVVAYRRGIRRRGSTKPRFVHMPSYRTSRAWLDSADAPAQYGFVLLRRSQRRRQWRS